MYRYQTEKFQGYFDINGKSVEKALMKTPINGARLSSSFGLRKHPILGYNKMHRGTDLAAPMGTPVMASGTGVVTMAEDDLYYTGGTIIMDHGHGISTIYSHLESVMVSVGDQINQGDVIGTVGSTGRSTGPHLHYEVIYQGKKINPMTMKLPSGKILQDKELERFKDKVKIIYSNYLFNLYE